MIDLSTEIIPGYVITENGDVLSLNYAKKRGCRRMLKPQKIGSYLGVNAGGKIIHIHRLVALAFIENPENKPNVNHKDGDKFNNHVSNLEWVTRSENMIHAYRILGIKNNKTNLGNFYGKAFRARPIIQFDLNGNKLKEFDCIRRAFHELKIGETNITNCLSGRSKSAGGFIWKYA